MAQIFLRGVAKSYGSSAVFNDLTLSFADAATTAIVGASGSGKSTLLKIINGLTKVDDGEVHVLGRSLASQHLPTLRRSIGYAVQGIGLFPHMTVEQNISLLAKLERWSTDRIQARVAKLMELVELPHAYLPRYPFQLSGGEQQRVGICRALMLDPPILLLDEPFGSLDAITKCEIYREFLRIEQVKSRTIVLVTHDLREALKLAQYLVILDAGKIIADGRCQDVIAHPSHPKVRQLCAAQL